MNMHPLLFSKKKKSKLKNIHILIRSLTLPASALWVTLGTHNHRWLLGALVAPGTAVIGGGS